MTKYQRYQGREQTTILQAPTKKALSSLIKANKSHAKKQGMDRFRVLSSAVDPDGGYRAVVEAHNLNPITWIKSKISPSKEKTEDEEKEKYSRAMDREVRIKGKARRRLTKGYAELGYEAPTDEDIVLVEAIPTSPTEGFSTDKAIPTGPPPKPPKKVEASRPPSKEGKDATKGGRTPPPLGGIGYRTTSTTTAPGIGIIATVHEPVYGSAEEVLAKSTKSALEAEKAQKELKDFRSSQSVTGKSLKFGLGVAGVGIGVAKEVAKESAKGGFAAGTKMARKPLLIGPKSGSDVVTPIAPKGFYSISGLRNPQTHLSGLRNPQVNLGKPRMDLGALRQPMGMSGITPVMGSVASPSMLASSGISHLRGSLGSSISVSTRQEVMPGYTSEQSKVLQAWREGYNTYEELQNATGLSRSEIDKILKVLSKKGDLQPVARQSTPPRRFNPLGMGGSNVSHPSMLPRLSL